MDLTNKSLTPQKKNLPGLDERALRRCRAAQELEDKGNFEAARLVLKDYFERVGSLPLTEGLGEFARAEVLLRSGTLSGWIGSDKGIDGAQEFAQSLISESLRLFQRLGETARAAHAQIDLALCYWRTGAYDEARIMLAELIENLGDVFPEVEARALVNAALVEIYAGQYRAAHKLLSAAAPLYEAGAGSNAARGRFHMNLAIVYENLWEIEGRQDYLDLALSEQAGASYYLELAGHLRFAARAENNLGYLYFKIKRYTEAHHHLERAFRKFVDLKDSASIAQVNDSRALCFLAENRLQEADRVSSGAVHALEHGGQQALLADALTTRGIVLARLGQFAVARASLQRAVDLNVQLGNSQAAARATLTLITEFEQQLPAREALDLYRAADEMLDSTATGEERDQLRAAARVLHSLVTSQLRETGLDELLTGGSLHHEVQRYEGKLIKLALDEEGGRLTRAARRLGTTHQALSYILQGRHKNLIPGRPEPQRRRRSIITKGSKKKGKN